MSQQQTVHLKNPDCDQTTSLLGGCREACTTLEATLNLVSNSRGNIKRHYSSKELLDSSPSPDKTPVASGQEGYRKTQANKSYISSWATVQVSRYFTFSIVPKVNIRETERQIVESYFYQQSRWSYVVPTFNNEGTCAQKTTSSHQDKINNLSRNNN